MRHNLLTPCLPLLLFLSIPAWSQSDETRYASYARWLDDDFIRVGVKKPVDKVELSAEGTLLVLDGKSVVGTIRPGGTFYVLPNRSPSDEQGRWVQIAAGTIASMEQLQQDQEAKHEDLSFSLVKVSNTLHALRIGPFENRVTAEQVRQTMINEGFTDAFLPRVNTDWPWVWVDSNYDKRALRSRNPALVRADPEQAIKFADNGYRGILRFRRTGAKVQVINELPIETYLRGVVPTELGPKSFPELEAIKAQAVAARTYAIKNMGRFNRRGYDICDTQACQAYEGTRNETGMSDRAVRETEDLVLYHDGNLIDALYTSTCGGHTDDVENVFNGRASPYLRGKSSYLAEYPSWRLPEKKTRRENFIDVSEDLAVKLTLYGFRKLPDLRGVMSGTDLQLALKTLTWVFGEPPTIGDRETVSRRDFWQYLAALPIMSQAVENQIEPADLGVLLRQYDVPDNLAGFAALCVRYDLVNRGTLERFGNDNPITRAEAYAHLIHFSETLGPEVEWVRWRLENVRGDKMDLSRGSRTRTINISGLSHYITQIDGSWEFIDAPKLESWDRIYIPKEPFPFRLIYVRESGVVASVDRFSAFDTWIEKKTVSELENRARRFVRGIKGIRDVKVVSRAETGRVTKLRFILEDGEKAVTGLRIRRSLGVPDNLFDLIPSYRNGKLVHLTVIGRGWGHGVGMSQVGAFGLARMGWTFDKILTYYYTDVTLNTWKR